MLLSNIDEKVIEIGEYVAATGSTVRAAAEKFGVSKSTVHTAVTIMNGLCGISYNQGISRLPDATEN